MGKENYFLCDIAHRFNFSFLFIYCKQTFRTGVLSSLSVSVELPHDPVNMLI